MPLAAWECFARLQVRRAEKCTRPRTFKIQLNCSFLIVMIDPVDGLRQAAWDMIIQSNTESILTTAAAISRLPTISGNPLTVVR